jgi:hypothetical protein
MKTTWNIFEETTKRGRNRSTKAQLVVDYYYYYCAVGFLDQHAVLVSVYGMFLFA